MHMHTNNIYSKSYQEYNQQKNPHIIGPHLPEKPMNYIGKNRTSKIY